MSTIATDPVRTTTEGDVKFFKSILGGSRKEDSSKCKEFLDTHEDAVARFASDERNAILGMHLRRKRAGVRTILKLSKSIARNLMRRNFTRWLNGSLETKPKAIKAGASGDTKEKGVLSQRAQKSGGAVFSPNLKLSRLELLVTPGYRRQGRVNAVLEKESVTLFNDWISTVNEDQDFAENNSPDEYVQKYCRHLREGKRDHEYTRHKIGAKITVTQPCHRALTMQHLETNIFNFVSEKTKGMSWFNLSPFKPKGSKVQHLCEKFLRGYYKNRTKFVYTDGLPLRYCPVDASKSLRQHLRQSKNMYKWVLKLLPGHLDYVQGLPSQESPEQKWLKALNYAIIVCHLASKNSKGYIDEMSSKVQFKKKTVKPIEKNAFKLLLKLICAQLAIMHLNGYGVTMPNGTEKGESEGDNSPEAKHIASRVAWEVSNFLDHGEFEESLCTAVITDIVPAPTKEAFSEDYIQMVKNNCHVPQFSNSDGLNYLVKYDTPWGGSSSVDPRLSALRYEWFNSGEVLVDNQTTDVSIYASEERKFVSNSFHYRLDGRAYEDKRLENYCCSGPKAEWWHMRAVESESLNARMEALETTQALVLQDVTAAKEDREAKLLAAAGMEVLEQERRERKRRVFDHEKSMEQMNKEEEELIHELHYWEEQRKKERAQIKAIENGEMEPGRFIANMAMDAADCIGFSRHKNQVSHGEDVLKNDLTITFNRSLVR
jgi:hypothetical protein